MHGLPTIRELNRQEEHKQAQAILAKHGDNAPVTGAETPVLTVDEEKAREGVHTPL